MHRSASGNLGVGMALLLVRNSQVLSHADRDRRREPQIHPVVPDITNGSSGQ